MSSPCSSDAATGQQLPFRSLAAEPTGEAIKIKYDMQPATPCASSCMARVMSACRPAGLDTDLVQDIEMVMRCLGRLPDGGAELEYEVASFSMSAPGVPDSMGASKDYEGLAGSKVKVQLGPDGRVTVLDMDDLLGEGSPKIKELFNTPGFQGFVPMPEGGMRVGEAIDISKIMPKQALEELMAKSVPGSAMTPELRGEMVLKAVREVDGEQAAEFAVNVVLNLKATMSKGGESADMNMGMRILGTSLTSLRTGLPVGTGSYRTEMRMDMEAGDTEMAMTMHMDMEFAATRE
ncbi:MAG: hypothetical protein R3F05_04880 [Planctomycetota bacterium]